MVTDPVRKAGVHCGRCLRCGRCARERALRGAPARGGESNKGVVVQWVGHERGHGWPASSGLWAGLRLSLTMPPPTSLGGEFPSRHAP